MPYINENSRYEIDESVEELIRAIGSPGKLNYAITRLILLYAPKPNYSEIATITGVLENVKQEYYRRLAAPYEDNKIKENGDVY